MIKDELRQLATDFIAGSPGNVISAPCAISAEMVGLRLFAEPILAIAAADDPLFTRMQHSDIVGPHFPSPDYWVREAKSVVSFFLPFCEPVRSGNAAVPTWPSPEWLHARYEGQMLVSALSAHIRDHLSAMGYASVAPSLDARFFSRGKEGSGDIPAFTSNWSERHVAYVCGLGTFGLSKGLITAKGVAGRFGSIVTAMDIAPDTRPYTDPYEYCSFCGDCIARCPVGAISLETGKDHLLCSDFIDLAREKFAPRYGCGKCQVSVSCENRVPG